MATTHAPASAPSVSVPSSNHDGSYTVSWGSISHATRYTLQQRINSGSWSTVYSGSDRGKSESGKTDGSYSYRVQACNVGGCGPWSASHTVHVAIIPSAPTNVHIHDTGNDKVIYQNLVWDAVSSATYYDVQGGDAGAGVNVGTATSYRVGSYQVQGLPSIVTAYVRACNANGCSGWVKGSGL